MSLNNIFIELSKDENVYKRYAKTIPGAITGWRLDPRRGSSEKIEFILTSGGNTFSYQDDVLEIYSLREDEFFQSANKRLFEAGYLKVYQKQIGDEAINTANIKSDSEVEEIAQIKDHDTLTKEIGIITSPVTLFRIFQVAIREGMPRALLQSIEKRISEVNTDPAMKSTIENNIANLTRGSFY